MDNATPSSGSSSAVLDRRSVLRRLTGTAAAAWAAPSVLSISRASAATSSGCSNITAFDDGTLQGWSVTGSGAASWQVTTLQSMTGKHAVWFGNATTRDSLHPTINAASYSGGRSSGTLTSATTTVASTDVISFDIRLAIESAPSYDVLRLFIVQGRRRRELWNKTMGGFPVLPHPENPQAQWDLLSTQGAWFTQSATVGTPAGIDLAKPVQFEFDFQTVDQYYNRTEGVFLDNITLPCSPANLATVPLGPSRTSNGVGMPGLPANTVGWEPPGQLTAPSPKRTSTAKP